MKVTCAVILVLAAAFAIAPSTGADEKDIPEPFRGATTGSPVKINYDDWNMMLRLTVVETGRSNRRSSLSQQANIGTRIKMGNQKSTRNEGNRLIFPAFAKDEANLEFLRQIRIELESIPGWVPMRDWTKNEQLAYWLNLYNITLLEQLAQQYPIKSLKKLTKGSKKKPSLWDQKLLNVAGVELSLNDIHHTILAEKWNSTLPMYGLWQGYIGGPNINREAYTADNVNDLLRQNAAEFVNSNRGMRIRGKTIIVSEYYDVNRGKFPDFDHDLKKHLLHLSDMDMRDRVADATSVKAKTNDFYIADLYGAELTERGASNATNEAAFDDMQVHVNSGLTGGGAMSITFSNYKDFGSALNKPRIPPHVIEYMEEARKKKSRLEGKVEIEEVVEQDRP